MSGIDVDGVNNVDWDGRRGRTEVPFLKNIDLFVFGIFIGFEGIGLSSWLIPKSYLPELDEDVRKKLNSFIV